MDEKTMLGLLDKVSNSVKDYWEEDKEGKICIEDSKTLLYADKITELMNKAVFDDEMGEHTKKDIASAIGLSAPTFSKIINNHAGIKPTNLEKVLKPILRCLSTEVDLTNDEMKKRVGELLSDGELAETIKANYFSFMLRIDCAVHSPTAPSNQRNGTLLSRV